jgi:hypothetical protein
MSLEQFLVGNATFQHRRHFQQEVEMVGHDSVGENPTARKVLLRLHERPELFALKVRKHESAVYHARYAVVDRRLLRGTLPRG